MWVPETWQSEEDVERDILLMAEYCVPTAEDLEERNTRVPDTILKYRRQMAANLAKPLNSDIDETACYIVSGRGKGIQDRVIRPGEPIQCHPLDEIELRKQIREVSGLGYSNALIEESLKARARSPDQPSNYKPLFKLVPSGSFSSSSGSSTQTVTPTKTAKRKALSSSDNGSGPSSTIVTPTKTENQDNKGRKRAEEFPPLK